jgi:acyl dehydratase
VCTCIGGEHRLKGGPLKVVFLEDIKVGSEVISGGRTVTEADIVSFAGLSGDYQPLHTDEVWVRENTDFDGRIAHGLLVLSVADGLDNETDDWKHLAWLEVQRRFIGPTYPGDTIRIRRRVSDVRRSRSRPHAGIVTLEVEVINQRDEVVQSGKDILLVGARSAGPDDDEGRDG